MGSRWFAAAALLLGACGGQTTLPQLPTGVDPTMPDVAVSDAELLTAGSDDTVPLLADNPGLLIVDDDKVQCPDAQFTSINAAITAALPGATIRVCPGLYAESVHVNKAGLLLQAQRQQGHATQCQTRSNPDPTREAIVAYNAGFLGALMGFFIEADNVTVEGFTIQPDASVTSAQTGIGIFTSPTFSGYDIRHNLAQNNTFGIDVNSHGENTTHVRENCVRNNNMSQIQAGFGIFSNAGLRNARIENNFCTGQRLFCILLTGGPNVDVQVTHNASVNDSAIALNVTTNFVVDHNKVTNPRNAAILLGAGVDTGEVNFNNLSGGPASETGISIRAAQIASNATASPSNLIVKSNKVVGFAGDGIRLGDASTANTLVANRLENNGLAGIRVTDLANNNTIQNNHMRHDNPDCFDDTQGVGTSGTANFWIRNFGFTEEHAGLCKHGK